MKLKVSVSLGLVGAHKKVEIDIDREDYLDEDGKLDNAALEETARDILFGRLISWDWSISEEDDG